MEDGPFWGKGNNCFFLVNKTWIGLKRIKDTSAGIVSWILDSWNPGKLFFWETKRGSKESRTWAASLCPESWIISQCFQERTFLEAQRYTPGFRTQPRRSCHRFLKNLDDFFHSGSSEIKLSPLWYIVSILYWILNSNSSPWIYFHIAWILEQLSRGNVLNGLGKEEFTDQRHTQCVKHDKQVFKRQNNWEQREKFMRDSYFFQLKDDKS